MAKSKAKKRKRVTVQLLKRMHAGEVTEPYRIMEELLESDHGDLEGVKIAIAWRLDWRVDANGILTLGRCRKRGDLDRELDNFDFVVLLNKEAWQTLNTKQKQALVDHQLCHAQVVMDSDGEPKKDDRGRLVCRIRRHDIEEFREVVDRHGLYTDELSAIAQAGIKDADRPLLKQMEGDSAEVNGDNWRSLPVSELGLTEKQQEKIEQRCQTLGEFSDLMAAKGDFWPREFDRLHRASVENAWEAFWKRIKAAEKFGARK